MNANPFGRPSPGGAGEVSSKLISQLAVIALKLRLADQTSVACDVKATGDMLKGSIGPVTVKGRGWQSNLGLTCMAIEATVDTCKLDISKVMANRKLVLTEPAMGKAMIALSSQDFGNFITHPLLRPPALTQSSSSGNDGAQLTFLKDGSRVNPKDGSVTFFASYMGSKYECRLSRASSGESNAVITLQSVEKSEDANKITAELGETLTDFFNKMTFELDGTFLSFRDMMVTDKGREPNVMLSLNIKVKKFPSPGLDF